MKAFIIVAFALLSVAAAKSQHGKPEMHWVDFDGTVPENALRVARNASNTLAYIGQGYFEGIGLLPGMLQEGVKEMRAVANGEVHTIKHNIKILATTSKNPSSDFPWVSIHYANLHNLKNLHFLNLPVGGTESHADLFIGRHSEPEFTDIGKVSTVATNQGLTVVDAEGKPVTFKNFEVLTMLNFDCSDDQEEESSSEDSNETYLRTNSNKQQTTRRLPPHNYRSASRQTGAYDY